MWWGVQWRERQTEWRARRIADPVARLRFLKLQKQRPTRSNRTTTLVALALTGMIASGTTASAPGVAIAKGRTAERQLGQIWLVELRADRETYSNGLQVDLGFAVRNTTRSGRPAGIVYHTTESQLAEFDPAENQKLRRLGRGLVAYVREERAYHYVIDRFGRVFRVVAESDIAHHAGHSVWADERQTYVGLNDSFLAIALETQTRTGDEAPEITPAQTHAARISTDMLRSRYGIPGGNCVTHAQVSVNPRNFRVGWHTDWAGNFPFAELGLPDNYLRPLPAIEKFGFGYDPAFFAATGAQMWRGVVAAEDRLRARAAKDNLTIAALKSALREEYRQRILLAEGERSARTNQ